MGKQKFQIGDKVALVKHPYMVGTVEAYEHAHRQDRPFIANVYTNKKKYLVHINNHFTRYFYSDDLQFADLHSLVEHLDKHGDIPKLTKAEEQEIKEKDITGPYGYVPSFNKEEEKINNIKKPIIKEETKKCKYCDVPFNEIEESQEEPGACEYCVEQRKHISKINLRKSAYVDLEKFSIYGHEGDWLEVTEWTNGEGFDVCIHYANDHDETDHIFKLSYDELTAIVNIVTKFGVRPVIFTKDENKNNY